MMEHLPALQIAVPLLAAPLCVFVRHPIAVRVWAIAVAWATFAISAHCSPKSFKPRKQFGISWAVGKDHGVLKLRSMPPMPT